jgi:hypothetical protein
MERPRITPGERLRIAITFAQQDLDTLSSKQWRSLRSDLATFLGCKAGRYWYPAAGGFAVDPEVHPEDKAFSEQDIRALHGEVCRILYSVARGDFLVAELVPIQGYFGIKRSWQDNEQIMIACGPTHEMALMTLLHLLNQGPLDRLQNCPECGTIFFRVQKQRYCSLRCTKRVNARALREQEGKREAENRRRRERYREAEKKRRRELGASI